VYGRVALEVAKEVWKGECMDETGLSALLNEYYQRFLDRKSELPSLKLWERYARLLFFDPKGILESLKDYPLIEPRAEVPVIVMLSEGDECYLERIYIELFKEKDISKRQEAYLRNRRWLHERTLRLLPERTIANLPPSWRDTSFRWVPFRSIDNYYHKDTGFRWREEDLGEEVWML